MSDEPTMSLSAHAEIAQARATADRCRRLEAELRDRERDLDECRDELIAVLETASANEDALKRLQRAHDEAIVDLEDMRDEVERLRHWKATLRIPQRIALRVLRVIREELR